MSDLHGGCQHEDNHEVSVILGYQGIKLLPVGSCRPCASRMWEQARGDFNMTVEIIDSREQYHIGPVQLP